MEKTFSRLCLIASLAAAAGLAAPAAAQQYDREDDWYEQQRQQDRRYNQQNEWEQGEWEQEDWNDPWQDQSQRPQQRGQRQQRQVQQDWRSQDQRFQDQRFRDDRFQDQPFQDQRSRTQGRFDQTQPMVSGRAVTLSGTVVDARPVRLRGFGQEHSLVRLRLDDGRTAVVNLGPDIDISEVERNFDDTIQVRGHRGTINGRAILFATELRTRDDFRRIAWDDMPFQQGGMGMQQQRMRQGRVFGTEGGFGVGTVEQVISNWPQSAQRAAEEMVQKYGQPDGVTDTTLIWHNNGPWEKTIVTSEPVQHNFPEPHQDVLTQVVKLDIPADKFDELAEFDGSLVANRTSGELAATCHTEGANILALNLAHQLVNDQISVEDAKRQLAEQARQLNQGQQPQLATRLQFQSDPQAGDPGQRFRQNR